MSEPRTRRKDAAGVSPNRLVTPVTSVKTVEGKDPHSDEVAAFAFLKLCLETMARLRTPRSPENVNIATGRQSIC